MLDPTNKNKLAGGNQYDFSRKSEKPLIHSLLHRKEGIFSVGISLEECVEYLNNHPACGTFMLVVDANPTRLLGINADIVTAIPKTPGGFHNNATAELNYYLKRNEAIPDLVDTYSGRGAAHVINGTVGPGRLDLRIDGGNESGPFYFTIEKLYGVCQSLGIKLYVFESTRNNVASWGLSYLKQSAPKRTRELKASVEARKVPFIVKECVGNNYHAVAAATRYISVGVLNTIISCLADDDLSRKRFALDAIVELKNGITTNVRKTGFDIDFLVTNKEGGYAPRAYTDPKVERIRGMWFEIANEVERFYGLSPEESDLEQELKEFSKILLIKVSNLLDSYKIDLPEPLRSNATDTYDWNLAMYKVLYGANQDPWKNLGHAEIISAYSLSSADKPNYHLGSQTLGVLDTSPGIATSQADRNIIDFDGGKYIYRKRSQVSTDGLDFEIMQALYDAEFSILDDKGFMPDALYFGEIFKLGDSYNTQAARELSVDEAPVRYAAILSYPDGGEKIALLTSINTFLEYAKITLNKYGSSLSSEDILVDFSLKYSELQRGYYKYLFKLLEHRAEVSVNKVQDVFLGSRKQPNYTINEFVKGYSPKDKKSIEALSPDNFKEYLSKLAVAVVCHIVTQKTRSIEDDYIYDGKVLTLTNANTALDPEGFYENENDLSSFIYLHVVLPAFNLLLKKNAGDENVDEYINHFLSEVEACISNLEMSLDFDKVRDELGLKLVDTSDLESRNGVDIAERLFRYHLMCSIEAFRKTPLLYKVFQGRFNKVYNFLDYQVPTQTADDVKHDVLRRYGSVISLAFVERAPFTQGEIIDKLTEIISFETLTDNFRNLTLYSNEIKTVDMIYIALDLEIKREANKKIVNKIPNDRIPKFVDLVSSVLENEKVGDFVQYFRNNFSRLKTPDEKLIRFYVAVCELSSEFDRIDRPSDFKKHVEIISNNFEGRT